MYEYKKIGNREIGIAQTMYGWRTATWDAHNVKKTYAEKNVRTLAEA